MEQQGWVKFFKQMKDFKVNKGNKRTTNCWLTHQNEW